MLKHRTGAGIMTGDTADGTAVSRILGFFPAGMSETQMTAMTAAAYLVRRIPEHSRIIGPVELMTFRAVVPPPVFVKRLVPAVEGIGMADSARSRGTGQHGLVVGRVGGVALAAWISDAVPLKVRMGEIE